MFAIFRTGGKQYSVAKNDTLFIQTLEGKEGDTVQFDDVLYAEGGKKATVVAKIVAHLRAPKITIIKKKRRKHYRRKIGHRQPVTKIEITDIKAA